MTIAVQFVEPVERGEIVAGERSFWVARYVDAFPRGQMAEDVLAELFDLLLELADLVATRIALAQDRDARFEFDQALFAFDDHVH